MKKIFALFAVAALVSFSGCKKDDPKPEQGNSSTPATPPATTVLEGVFAPGAKIQTIKEDGDIMEMWTWTGSKLTVVTPYENGAAVTAEATSFEYDGKDRFSRIYDNEMEMTVGYSGDKLQSITVNREGEEALAITVTGRTGDKISKVDINMSTDMIGDLMSEMMGDEEENPVTGVEANAVLSWNGNNVSRAIVNINATLTMTLSQIAELPFVEPILEQYPAAQTVVAMFGNRQMNLLLKIADTSDYTYDGKNNPFYGYLYALDEFTMLSKENVASASHARSAAVELPSELMALLAAAIPDMTQTMNYPIPSEPPATYTYEYNSANFPISRTDGETLTEYIYAE